MENRECCNETGSFESKQVVFAHGFEELNENDQQEILNLIAFKKSMAGL